MTNASGKSLFRTAKDALHSARLDTTKAACQSLFDAAFYQQQNADVTSSGVDPLLHFRRFGQYENRIPNSWYSEPYVFNMLSDQAFSDANSVRTYVDSDLSQKPRLVFVSHDASRTGAPAIILRLLEIFSQSGAFECFTILDGSGERLDEFRAVSHVHVMSRWRHDHEFTDADAYAELAALFDKNGVFEGNAPLCALVNSAESYRIGKTLAQLGVPVISLIHEIAAYYTPKVFEDFCHFSDKVVFPSQFVSRAADLHCDLDMSKTVVRGQGLLDDDFGALDRDQCRKLLREELDVDQDTFVALNVGSKDVRKGIDMFVDAARLFLQRGTPPRPVVFAWYGGEDSSFDYAQRFVAQHGLEEHIKLMPSTSHIEQVFLGGDLFLLTARADPFPCVIHEAMACGLPVVAFHDGGGAPELVGNDCGTIVEMGNLAKMADVLTHYLDAPEQHATHARNAREKIAQSWQYEGYCDDIYTLIKGASKTQPSGGWPDVAVRRGPAHLVIMHGRLYDLELLDRLGDTVDKSEAVVALIGGRFEPNIDDVIAGLKQRGFAYTVRQPLVGDLDSVAAIAQELVKTPKPGAVTMINTVQYLSPERLMPLAYPKHAVCTDGAMTTEDLYMRLPYLSGLQVAYTGQADALIEMNPAAKGRVTGLEDGTDTGHHDAA